MLLGTAIGVFSFGLIIGSFLNVCAWRLPRGESLVRPRSRCPLCGRLIAWYDNVPLLSYAWLGARCRSCGGRISARYPAVELLCGLLFAGLWWRWRNEGFWSMPVCGASAILIVLALIDWDTFMIPDVLSLGLLALGLLCAPLNPVFDGGAAWRIGESAVGASAGFLMCWGIAVLGERIFKKEAMGGGDVKLMAAVGAWSGALGTFDCMMVASLLGSVYGVGLIVGGRIKRQDPIPFGPFLSAGALLNLFYVLPLGFPFH